MKTYEFSDMVPGLEEQFMVNVEEEKVMQFAKMSGDFNSLHVDDDFARSRGFSTRVVYGMLVASFYSTLVGMYLPGKNALLLDVTTRFHKPVFIGDVLTINGIVNTIDERFKKINIKAYIHNNREELVNSGSINVKFI